ncbi:MAG: dihydropyrimidinase [Bacteroidales bacterium]|nr:dihydropyrimidinase [Bacteroidales bacterium]
MAKNEIEKLLIRNGKLVEAGGSSMEDLVLENGIIAARGKFDASTHPGCRNIDANGKYVIPGGFDPHVHFSLPSPAGKSCDDFKSGSQAALAGGTTSFMDFVTPRRGQSLMEALRLRREEAAESQTSFGLHMGISEWNPKVAAEVVPLMEKDNIRSFKAYLAYRDSIGIGYEEVYELMRVVGPAGGLVMVHCEEGEMISRLQRRFLSEGKTRSTFHALSRPPEAEIRAIEKVIEISAKTNCPAYIVHISTGRGADLIASAKKDGLRVYGETCPHYLLLDESVYDPSCDDMQILPYILSPPIRVKDDQARLWERLSDGTLDVVATDHCPFNLYGQKDRGLDDFTKIPNGAGSIRHRLQLLYTFGVLTSKITINQFVSLTSTRPAEIFGMGHRKGKLLPGCDADIVIWDPDFETTITIDTSVCRCDSDVFEGFHIMGRPETVIMNGKIIDQRSGNPFSLPVSK